ncbi:MAG: type II toxin-antitoxin system VapC family toxin [Chloroflexota bacterium]|nr:type II toxin-antitoxin system VapC family toxin [Chloroflexota bacterium]
MSGKYLLDTGIVIALFANDRAVVEQIEDAEEIFIPSIVIGELYYGARQSGRARENVARVDLFAEANVLLMCDTETCRWYGVVKDLLRQKGSFIPENDVWISALSLRHGLILVTRDDSFNAVTNLKTERW